MSWYVRFGWFNKQQKSSPCIKEGKRRPLCGNVERLLLDVSSQLTLLNSELCNNVTDIQQDINTAIQKDLKRKKNEYKKKSDILVINTKQSEFYADGWDLKDSLNFHDKEHKDLDHNVLQEWSLLKQKNAKLAFELNIFHQRDRSDNLEISGRYIWKSKENFIAVIVSIAQSVGM